MHTGQHYDPLMNDVFFSDLGIRKPDIHLGVGSASHAEQTANIMLGFEKVAAELAPHLVVVVGDGGSGVGVAEGTDFAKMISGVNVGKRVGVELAISVGVGEENFTGISVGVGSGVARELATGKSARLQASRTMVNVSKVETRVIHHHPIITPIDRKKP